MNSSKNCYLCHGNEFEQVDGKVRDLPELAILKCRNCGLIFLESFDHIEETYYADSKMHHDPKGARGRIEYEMDDIRRFEYCKALIGNKKIIDFGCGYGDFIFKAKDIASETIGIEADRTILAYLKNKGYTVYPDLNHIEESERFDVITMFHVLEHLPDPRKILSRFKSCLNKEGKIIIEVPNSEDALLTLYNNKGFSEFFWSCHLYLFSAQTLRTLCVSAGFKVDYILQIQRCPLSNHLYWLAKDQPGGHLIWDFLDSPSLFSEYTHRLANLGRCDTLIASLSLPEVSC